MRKMQSIENKYLFVMNKNFSTNVNVNANNNKKDNNTPAGQTNNKVQKQKYKIPHFCSIFHLSEILKMDMIELVKKFSETVQQEVTDPMEYVNEEDLEIFMLEQNLDYEIEEHKSVKIKRPMVVTIMGHVDHGNT